MGLGTQNGWNGGHLAPPCRMLACRKKQREIWGERGERGTERERERERNCFILDSRLFFESALRAPVALILGMDLNQ